MNSVPILVIPDVIAERSETIHARIYREVHATGGGGRGNCSGTSRLVRIAIVYIVGRILRAEDVAVGQHELDVVGRVQQEVTKTVIARVVTEQISCGVFEAVIKGRVIVQFDTHVPNPGLAGILDTVRVQILPDEGTECGPFMKAGVYGHIVLTGGEVKPIGPTCRVRIAIFGVIKAIILRAEFIAVMFGLIWHELDTVFSRREIRELIRAVCDRFSSFKYPFIIPFVQIDSDVRKHDTRAILNPVPILVVPDVIAYCRVLIQTSVLGHVIVTVVECRDFRRPSR